MYKVKNPQERIRAVLLSRITKLLCLAPFNGRYFHPFSSFSRVFFIAHSCISYPCFAARRLGEVEWSLFLDNAGRVMGAGDVFGAMRCSIVYPSCFDLLRPTQLDVAGIASKSHPVDPRKRRLLQSCFISLIDGRLRPCYASHHLAEVLVPSWIITS